MQISDEMVEKAAEAIFTTWAQNRGVSENWAECTHLHHSIVDEAREEARAALTAALAEMWRPVGEAEPNRTYLLGWHDWRDHAWCTEVAPAIHGQRFANGYSNVSLHGSATHFMHLPAPPKTRG